MHYSFVDLIQISFKLISYINMFVLYNKKFIKVSSIFLLCQARVYLNFRRLRNFDGCRISKNAQRECGGKMKMFVIIVGNCLIIYILIPLSSFGTLDYWNSILRSIIKNCISKGSTIEYGIFNTGHVCLFLYTLWDKFTIIFIKYIYLETTNVIWTWNDNSIII